MKCFKLLLKIILGVVGLFIVFIVVLINGESYETITKNDLAMLMASMASNMQSPLKVAANLKYVYEGPSMPAKDLRYEHMIPTNYMILKILDGYLNPGNVDLDSLFEQYNVAVIPKTMDKILEKVGLQSVMPVAYLDGDPASKRYYNMLTFGDENLLPIKSIDPKDKGKIIGNEYVTLNNKIVEAKSETEKELNNNVDKFSKKM